MHAIVKARSVALTLHDDRNGDRAFMLRLLKDEGSRRADATESVCHLALMAYEEGADHTIARLLQPVVYVPLAWQERRKLLPSYTEMRNFLIGELDAHELIACRVAFNRIERRNRPFRAQKPDFYSQREAGWL